MIDNLKFGTNKHSNTSLREFLDMAVQIIRKMHAEIGAVPIHIITDPLHIFVMPEERESDRTLIALREKLAKINATQHVLVCYAESDDGHTGIVLTAYDRRNHDAALLELGKDNVLGKTVYIKKIDDSVGNLLGRLQ